MPSGIYIRNLKQIEQAKVNLKNHIDKCRFLRIKKICFFCGKEFFISISREKDNRGKYCSKFCYNKGKIGEKHSEETKIKIGLKNRGQIRKKKICINCIICGNKFYVCPCFLRVKKYCSKECSKIGFSQNLSLAHKRKEWGFDGKIPWNKGNHIKTNDEGFKKGHIPWNLGLEGFGKGHIVSEETRKKIALKNRINNKCKRFSPKTEFKNGHISMNKGKNLESLYGIEKAQIISKKISLKNKQRKHIKFGKRKIFFCKECGKEYERLVCINKTRKFCSKECSKKYRSRIRRLMNIQLNPQNPTSIEIKIHNFLKELNIDFFVHKYIYESCEVDIFISSLNLIIECDGDYFHCNPKKYSADFVRFPNSKEEKDKIIAKVIWEKDNIKTRQLLEKGYNVLRLWECDIRKMDLNEFKRLLNSIVSKMTFISTKSLNTL